MPSLLLAAALLQTAPPADPPPPPAGRGPEHQEELSEGETLSYALGVNVARGLLRDGLDPDAELFLAGLRDTLTDRPLRLGEEELAAALDAAAAKVRDAAAARQKAAVEAASAAFLEEFAAGGGVTAADGGVLIQKMERRARGSRPTADSRVRLHYAATFAGADAPFFTTRGGPAPVAAVAAMLPGLRAVLPTMPAGSRWELALPASAAYGAAGGPGVPPHAALRLDVELLDVLPPAVAPSAAAGTDAEPDAADAP